MADTFIQLPIKCSKDAKIGHVQCSLHSREQCPDCNLDFKELNELCKAFSLLKKPIPPPANQGNQQRSLQVNKMKEAGNEAFKKKAFDEATRCYNLALTMALQRPRWELFGLVRDEAAIVLCNRSTSYYATGSFAQSLADADVVARVKPSWVKGHYRKARALMYMDRLEEAKIALGLGLMYANRGAFFFFLSLLFYLFIYFLLHLVSTSRIRLTKI